MQPRTVRPEEFDPGKLPRNSRHAITIALGGSGELDLPVYVIRGANPGKTLLIIAGVHGDEYEGVRTILDLCAELDPATMSGDLIASPVVNPPAFWNGSRTSPLDEGNLARLFPGKPDGSPTEVTAWWVDQLLIARADLLVDLHSAGVKCLMPTLAGYYEADPVAHQAALAFGAPVLWTHPTIAPGRSLSAALARGVPSIYVEARGAGRIHPDDLRIYQRGCRTLLHHLGILEGEFPPISPSVHLYGNGDIDQSASATARGFLMPSVELLDRVEADQQLGVVVDLHGNVLQTLTAPCGGRVALIHAFPVVHPGEPLFLISGEWQ